MENYKLAVFTEILSFFSLLHFLIPPDNIPPVSHTVPHRFPAAPAAPDGFPSHRVFRDPSPASAPLRQKSPHHLQPHDTAMYFPALSSAPPTAKLRLLFRKILSELAACPTSFITHNSSLK